MVAHLLSPAVGSTKIKQETKTSKEFQLSKDLFKCTIRNLTTVTLVSFILMNSLLKNSRFNS
jgi:hypothetical protein